MDKVTIQATCPNCGWHQTFKLFRSPDSLMCESCKRDIKIRDWIISEQTTETFIPVESSKEQVFKESQLRAAAGTLLDIADKIGDEDMVTYIKGNLAAFGHILNVELFPCEEEE